jgi:xanthine/CO dehydrogenase XdhC/CoxF family maturation factor
LTCAIQFRHWPKRFSSNNQQFGLELGGTSPQEIAVAILAEIIAVRRGGRATFRSR